MSQMVSSKKAAQVLGKPEGTLRYWRNIGRGPIWYKMEGSIMYDTDDLEAFKRQCIRVPSVRADVEAHSAS